MVLRLTFLRKEKQVMGLTGDRYEGTFRGHPVELVRNEWIKVLKLLIDGNVVARTSARSRGASS